MKCPTCQSRTKKLIAEYDYSKQSGIKDLILTDVDSYHCKKCDETYFDLGDHSELTEKITDALLELDLLEGSQIRFIRKHFFEETIFQYAKRAFLNPKELSKAEKDLLSKKEMKPVSLKVQESVIRFHAGNVSISIGGKTHKF